MDHVCSTSEVELGHLTCHIEVSKKKLCPTPPMDDYEFLHLIETAIGGYTLSLGRPKGYIAGFYTTSDGLSSISLYTWWFRARGFCLLLASTGD